MTEQAPSPSTLPESRLKQRIANDFTYHPPQGDQLARYITLRTEARVLAELFATYVPEGRELSLALTNLEQAVFWANAGIARSEASST